MSANKKLLDRYVERYNAGDLDGVMDLYADDAVQGMPDGIFEGRSAIRERLANELEAIPDVTHTVVSFIEQGDAFADEWTFVGNVVTWANGAFARVNVAAAVTLSACPLVDVGGAKSNAARGRSRVRATCGSNLRSARSFRMQPAERMTTVPTTKISAIAAVASAELVSAQLISRSASLTESGRNRIMPAPKPSCPTFAIKRRPEIAAEASPMSASS